MEEYSWILTLLGETSLLWIPLIIYLFKKSKKNNKGYNYKDYRNNIYESEEEKCFRLYLNNQYPLKETNQKYTNHCWKCKFNINSNVNLKCPSCGWYICSNCGSCKSGCMIGKEYFNNAKMKIQIVLNLPDDDINKQTFNHMKSKHLKLIQLQREESLQKYKRDYQKVMQEYHWDDSDKQEEEARQFEYARLEQYNNIEEEAKPTVQKSPILLKNEKSSNQLKIINQEYVEQQQLVEQKEHEEFNELKFIAELHELDKLSEEQ